MKYETYSYIKNLLAKEKSILHKDFQTACSFISTSSWKKGVDEVHKVFSQRLYNIEQMEQELYDAAAATYKNHPNPEMRKFWGLKE